MSEQGTLFDADCPHDHVEEILLHSGPHYAKQVCTSCKRFLNWVKNPETIEREKKNAEILTALAKLETLSPWERQFVRDLVTHKHISPRQQDRLDQLRDVYLNLSKDTSL